MSTIPLDVGVVGRADYCPNFKPPGKEHPIFLCFGMSGGRLSVAWTSHTTYPGDWTLTVDTTLLPSAFIGNSPLKTGRSPLIIKSGGRSMMAEVRVKKLDIPDRFGETDCLAWRSQNVTAANGDMLEVLIHVHRRVQIPEAEWKIFRMRLLQKLGHI